MISAISSHGAIVSGLDISDAAVFVDGPHGTITGEPVVLRVVVGGGPFGLCDTSGRPLSEHATTEVLRCLRVEVVGPGGEPIPLSDGKPMSWVSEPLLTAPADQVTGRRPSMSFAGRRSKREIMFTPHEPGEFRVVLVRDKRAGEVRRVLCAVHALGALPTPQNIRVEITKTDSVELAWDAGGTVPMTDALRFAVRVEQLDNPRRMIVDNQTVDQPRLRVESLQRCTNYAVTISCVAARSSRQGEWSAPFEFITSKTSTVRLDASCAGKNCTIDSSGLAVTISGGGGTVLSEEGYSVGRHFWMFTVAQAGANSWCGVSLKPPGNIEKWVGFDTTGWAVAGYHSDSLLTIPRRQAEWGSASKVHERRPCGVFARL
jgi:hypothetical protein